MFQHEEVSFVISGRYHLDLCKNVFGEGIYPDVDATNLYYGGTDIAGMVNTSFHCLRFSVLFSHLYDLLSLFSLVVACVITLWLDVLW